ncbi:thiamine diphosphokinase [Anaerovirgula multivorans]|uniref:Thiamine diphosphokinase n=1 Tax=Anaerovirgula multivorans TaxID=312168 RepID=A0A239A541_9FIRM|nr:thiamine diphosphokinase [Anaerovirgula multivorans]SNR90680.1 thiamine diphosphokinase [Anaerovirgula multivorans]
MEIAIITNGNIHNLELMKRMIQDKYIICADGAAKYLVQSSIVPHLLVGDFDSIDSSHLLWMKDQGVNWEKFPTKKDATDTELAVEYAIKMKPKSITIIGALGSRQDHSIANVMLLNKILQHKIQGKIIDENNEITITDSVLEVEGELGETISIIPLSNTVKGVTLKGLEYPLVNRDIPMGSTLGISNVFSSKIATIAVVEGTLMIIKSKE